MKLQDVLILIRAKDVFGRSPRRSMRLIILSIEFCTSVGSDMGISLAWVKAKESPVIDLKTRTRARATISDRDKARPAPCLPSRTAAKLPRMRLRPSHVTLARRKQPYTRLATIIPRRLRKMAEALPPTGSWNQPGNRRFRYWPSSGIKVASAFSSGE
jgi:hypothetical protein